MKVNFKPKRSRRMQTSALAISICCAAVPGVAIAQDAGVAKPNDSSSTTDDTTDDSEIVVTAQRREERLQKVPISITVLTGETLDTSTGRGITDALRTLPGVQIGENFQSGGTVINIRGASNPGGTGNGSSTTAYYLDTVPFGFVKHAITPEATAYDLDRIEVLRGPQGTLYGASALNGVVRVLTKEPDLDRFEAKGRIIGSTTDGGDEGYRGDAAVNVPLDPGKIALRLVGGYQHVGGWIDRPNQRDANGGNVVNLRAKLKAKATDNFTIGLSAWFSRSDIGAPSLGKPDNTNVATFDESLHSDFDTYALKLGYDAPGFSIASATSYLRYGLRSSLDLGALGVPGNALDTNIFSHMFSQEINFASTGDGPLQWTGGLFYRKADDRTWQLRHNAAGAPSLGYLQPAEVKFLSESYAIFGELKFTFAGGLLDLAGGLRYFHDKVGIREISRSDSLTLPVESRDDKFNAVTPRAVLTAHPAKNLDLYLSYAQGFRSGISQAPQVLRVNPNFGPVRPDRLSNFEFGAKGSLFNGRLAFDTAVYYINWKDVQQTINVQACATCAVLPAALNTHTVRGPGVDVSVTVKPFKALTLYGSLSYNDLELSADVVQAPGTASQSILYLKGDRLANSQKFTASAGANLLFPIGSQGYTVELSGNVAHGSAVSAPTIVAGLPVPLTGDPITLVSAKLVIEAPKGWSVSLFADNILNENGTPLRSSVANWDQRLRPRTIGLQFDFKY